MKVEIDPQKKVLVDQKDLKVLGYEYDFSNVGIETRWNYTSKSGLTKQKVLSIEQNGGRFVGAHVYNPQASMLKIKRGWNVPCGLSSAHPALLMVKIDEVWRLMPYKIIPEGGGSYSLNKEECAEIKVEVRGFETRTFIIPKGVSFERLNINVPGYKPPSCPPIFRAVPHLRAFLSAQGKYITQIGDDYVLYSVQKEMVGCILTVEYRTERTPGNSHNIVRGDLASFVHKLLIYLRANPIAESFRNGIRTEYRVGKLTKELAYIYKKESFVGGDVLFDYQRADKTAFIEYYRESEIIALFVLKTLLPDNKAGIDIRSLSGTWAGVSVSGVRGEEFIVPNVLDRETLEKCPPITGIQWIRKVLCQYYLN